jgi:hypothetical protein
MFGWGSVASSLNTQRHVTRWSVDNEKSTITVSKGKVDFFSPTQSDVQVVVRGLCNTAANHVVQDYVDETKEWLASADAKIASAAEYKRINSEFARLTNESKQYLQEGQTDNSDVVVLKRHSVTEEDRPEKRIKIEVIDSNTHESKGEVTNAVEFYSVVAGQFRKKQKTGLIVEIKANEKFDLDTIVATNTQVKDQLRPLVTLSQPFQNSLQLRGHMTTLVQALSTRNNSGTAIQEVYNPGNCFRNLPALHQEYKLAVTTMVNLLTRKKDTSKSPEFVVLESGSPPIVLRNKGNNFHEQPTQYGETHFQIRKNGDTFTVSRKRPRSNTGYEEMIRFKLDNNTVEGVEQLVTGIDVYLLPKFKTYQSDSYNNISLDELYDAFIPNPQVRLYDTEFTNYLYPKTPSSNCVKGFFSDDNQASLNNGESVIVSEDTSDNISYYSETILQPCIETCAKQHEEELHRVPNHGVHHAVQLVNADVPDNDANRTFRLLCQAAVDEHAKGDWGLRLVPVKQEDIVWMSAHDEVIPEFTYQCAVSADSFSWYLGGSPSTTLDTLEGALAFLNFEASRQNLLKTPATFETFLTKNCFGSVVETESNLQRIRSNCKSVLDLGGNDNVKKFIEILATKCAEFYWENKKPTLKRYCCLDETFELIGALLEKLKPATDYDVKWVYNLYADKFKVESADFKSVEEIKTLSDVDVCAKLIAAFKETLSVVAVTVQMS